MRPTSARALAAASVLALALAACGGKKEEPPPSAAGSGSAPAGSGSAATPTPPQPPRTAEASPPPSLPPIDGLPDECNEYRATIQRLATCSDALPQTTRDQLNKNFERQWGGWAKLPEQDKRTLAAICKSSSDSVKAAASAGCGW